MSEEEYDYYMRKITTISKEKCTETMQKIVFPIPEDIKYYNLFSEKSIHNQLTDDDKTALKDYAPKLFNTFKDIEIPVDIQLTEQETAETSVIKHILKNEDGTIDILFDSNRPNKKIFSIEDAMFGLAKAVWEYRLYQSPHYAINYIGNNNFKRYAKDPKDKVKSFSGHIDSLIELMGGNFSSGVPKDPNMPTPAQLKTILTYAKEHPETYLPSKPKIRADKNMIRDYLTRLKLYNKTKQIEEFINAIK